MRDKNPTNLQKILKLRAAQRASQSDYQRLLGAMEDIADSIKAIELAVIESGALKKAKAGRS